MYSVIETEHFTQWVDGLRDMPTRIRLRRRLRRVILGILGDVKPVGDDVWEMREFFGPGWRMYYVMHGATIIVITTYAKRDTTQRLPWAEAFDTRMFA